MTLPPTSTPEASEAALRPINALPRRFAPLRAMGALIMREMSITYGKSPGGYIWAIAEPVAGIFLLTAIFSVGFRTPPMGTNFAIFYATGVVPFLMYMDLQGKVATAIRYSKKLLTYPAVTFTDALIARIIVNGITQLLIAYVIYVGLYLVLDTRTDPQVIGIALAILMTFALAIGVGTVNCFMFEAFPWWQHLWSIINRPLFLVSCIFFIFDDVPQPYRDWLWFNPLVHVVGQMRRSFYPSYSGDYVSPMYVFGISTGLMAIGLALLIRYHRDLIHS